MWGSFVLAAMFALILLYLPGYLLGRVYFSSSANSLAFAPVFTIALLVLLGVIAFPLSVSWFALPALAFLVSIIIFLIFRKPLAQGTRGSLVRFRRLCFDGCSDNSCCFSGEHRWGNFVFCPDRHHLSSPMRSGNAAVWALFRTVCICVSRRNR